MYYELVKTNNNGRGYDQVIIKNIRSIKQLLECRRTFDKVTFIEPKIVELEPSSMCQYGWRSHQSFKLQNKITGEDYGFFNCDNFGNLHKVFASRRVLIYEANRGGEQRKVIIGTVDENDSEELFL